MYILYVCIDVYRYSYRYINCICLVYYRQNYLSYLLIEVFVALRGIDRGKSLAC